MFIYEKNGTKRKACKVACLHCKVVFLTAEKTIKCKEVKYCSVKCRHDARKQRVQLACANCGNQFERKRSTIAKSKSGLNFCSRNCKDKAQCLGGLPAIMPDHYGTARRRAGRAYRGFYKRVHKIDKLSCLRCGYCEFECGVDIHHLDGNYANNSKQNIKALCAPCHRALHLGLWTFL